MKKRAIVAVLCALSVAAVQAEEWNFDRPHWVPMPFEAEVTSNVCVTLDDAQSVRVVCPEAGGAAWVKAKAKDFLGVSPKVSESVESVSLAGGSEAYELVTDVSGVVLRANTLAGVN